MKPAVEVSSRVDDAAWDDYVSRAVHADVYHLSGWRGVVVDTFAHPTYYLSATVGARIVGVLPIVHLKSRIFGSMLVSLPYVNYAGACADSIEVRQALVDHATGIATDVAASWLELRDRDEWTQSLPTKATKVSMRLALPSTAEELWRSFPSKLRSQVQRPRREGMTQAIGRADQLDAFYRVFSANMRDLGTPVYPRSFFLRILETFPNRTWISTVYSGATPVASGLLVGFRGTLEIPWASSLRAYNRQSPNMLLYWSCLEFACQRRYATFDFGRSTTGGSTFRFKAQWGAAPHQLYWHYWLKQRQELPDVSPSNAKYRMAIRAWRLLPVSVATRLGPYVVKYIP